MMLYFSVKDSWDTPTLPPPAKKGNYRSIRTWPRLRGCVMCITPLQTSCLIWILHAFCICQSKTSLWSAFQTPWHNDTVSHLLVVSFNHLKISTQLTVKAHPGASEQRISLSATSALHPSSSQTFWMLPKSLISNRRLAGMVQHLRPIPACVKLGF